MSLPLIITGSVLVLIIIGVSIYYLFTKKNKKEHPFLLYSSDGKHRTTIYPIVRIDPDNSNKKEFYFNSHKERLKIMPPSAWINNIAHREITYNNKQEFSYLKDVSIDDTQHLKVSLDPEEKVLALHRYKENLSRYKDAMGKYQSFALIGMFMMLFIIVIGVIYSTIAYVGVASDMVELEKQNVQYKKVESANIAALNDITIQLVAISGKNAEGEIVRELS
jgi:hypothetical protein